MSQISWHGFPCVSKKFQTHCFPFQKSLQSAFESQAFFYYKIPKLTVDGMFIRLFTGRFILPEELCTFLFLNSLPWSQIFSFDMVQQLQSFIFLYPNWRTWFIDNNNWNLCITSPPSYWWCRSEGTWISVVEATCLNGHKFWLH